MTSTLKRILRQIENGCLIARSVFSIAINGRPIKKPISLKKVLIFQNAKMGDMVCTTPVFRAIKNSHPETKVFVVGDKVNRELLKNNPDVDGYIVVDSRPSTLAYRIKRESFDAAFLILPSPDGLGTLLLSNIPFVVAPRLINGTSPFETIGYRLMASFAVRTDHRIGAYAPGEYLRLLEPVGIVARDTTKHLGFSGAAGIAANKFMSDHHLGDHIVVAITPSAGDKTKIWPADRFAEIADYLIDKYDARVVLIGSEHDRPEVESMIKGMRHQPINAINCFSIDEMKAFVSKMSLLIGSDTGLIYVAEAFRVPTIDIVGPMNEYEQPPRGKFHKTIVASRRKPALGLIDNRIEDMSEFKRQIDDITVGMVEKEVDELLPLLKSKASML